MHRTAAAALPRRSALSLAVAACVSLPLVVAGAAGADDDRARFHPRGEKIRIVPELEVEIWTDKGPGARYCVGEEIEIYFRTSADAYVAVFDTDTRGDTHRLFPNRYDREHFVRGGRTYRLPAKGYRFEVEGPPGVETLRVVAAESRRALRRAVDDLIYRRAAGPGHAPGWIHPAAGVAPADRSLRTVFERTTVERTTAERTTAERTTVRGPAHKIVVVPDDVAFASIEHRVRAGRACRPAHRPWWR